ncbi:MAG: hypothetical protein K2M65_07090, partial [Muribaculaceae bacterium]|nr:hypothetical protein [Muribaculaceae bacterium]
TDGKKRLLNGGGWTGRFGIDATHAEPLGYLAMVQTPDHMIHLVSSHNYYTFSPAWLLQP